MANNAGRLLFGIETEFGFSAWNPAGKKYDPQPALEAFLQVCASKLVHLRGSDSPVRMYLANGSLLYPDVGHPEYATAECRSPTSLLLSLRAGEKILAEAAQRLQRRAGFGTVNLYRTNVDYSAIGTTWGCHESYLSTRSPVEFAERALPHLFSRIIYTGAGGFDNRKRGAEFALSPRAFHLNRAVDYDGSGNRAIFSLRDEPHSGADYHRVHLICGESNYSDLSNYLKVGTTALVLAMAEAGVDFGLSERWSAVSTDTMRQFSRDSGCQKKATCDGVPAQSAIEIQYRYLVAAENHVHAPYMPAWAEEVCTKWRATLADLEASPELLVGKLDWPTKLAVFREYVRTRSDLSWSSLTVWTNVASRLSRALTNFEDPWPRVSCQQVDILRESKGQSARLVKTLSQALKKHDLDWSQLDAFQNLRDELCHLDIRFGQLHPRGVFQNLQDAGEIRGRILNSGQADEALDRAPDLGRARVRGDWIRHLASQHESYSCQWTGIRSESKYLNLQDPFVTRAAWEQRVERRAGVTLTDESRNRAFAFIDRLSDGGESGDESAR